MTYQLTANPQNHKPNVAPTTTKRPLAFNHLSLTHRLQMAKRHVSRAGKRGNRFFIAELFKPTVWSYLKTSRPIDGLNLYRQALSKLSIPQQMADPKGRTILIISRC